MVKSLGSVRSIQCQVLSARCYCVPVHWVGRSVPCAGESCSACALRAPRITWFVGLHVSGVRAVYEVPDSFQAACHRAWSDHAGKDLAGLVVEVTRESHRDEWRMCAAFRGPLRSAAVCEPEVAGAVASLYRLAKPLVGEGFVEWFDRVRVAQDQILSKEILPIFG
jgi:hypothetical protein